MPPDDRRKRAAQILGRGPALGPARLKQRLQAHPLLRPPASLLFPSGEQNARNQNRFKREQALALPDEIERWSLTTLREKVVKSGAKVIVHARYTVFQMAEVAVSRDLFRRILQHDRCAETSAGGPAKGLSPNNRVSLWAVVA